MGDNSPDGKQSKVSKTQAETRMKNSAQEQSSSLSQRSTSVSDKQSTKSATSKEKEKWRTGPELSSVAQVKQSRNVVTPAERDSKENQESEEEESEADEEEE